MFHAQFVIVKQSEGAELCVTSCERYAAALQGPAVELTQQQLRSQPQCSCPQLAAYCRRIACTQVILAHALLVSLAYSLQGLPRGTSWRGKSCEGARAELPG